MPVLSDRTHCFCEPFQGYARRLDTQPGLLLFRPVAVALQGPGARAEVPSTEIALERAGKRLARNPTG